MAKTLTHIALGAALLLVAASGAAAQITANSSRPVEAGPSDERAAPVFEPSIYEPDPAPALESALPAGPQPAPPQQEASRTSTPPGASVDDPQSVAAASTPAPAAREALPLGPPADTGAESRSSASGGADLVRMAAALITVVGLILLLWLAFRRFGGVSTGLIGQLGPGGRAPSGLMTVLGRYPVGRGQSLVILKLDRRILLLSQTGTGFSTLCEITDPDEVASILVKSRDEEGDSMASRFRSLLQSAERDESLAGSDAVRGPTTPRTAWMSEDDVYTDPEQYDEEPADDAAGALGSLRQRLESLRGMSA